MTRTQQRINTSLEVAILVGISMLQQHVVRGHPSRVMLQLAVIPAPADIITNYSFPVAMKVTG